MVLLPQVDGGMEETCKVEVEYEWLPLKCTHCQSLGHVSDRCPTRLKPRTQPPMRVYVKKPDLDKSNGNA